MSHLPFTLLAYLLNALSVTVDKFLLVKHIPNPLIYVFYISLVSCLALLGLPFTNIPSSQVLTLASVSTLLWTLGAYFMFKALQVGQVSRVIPMIGVLIPLFLLLHANQTSTITINQTWAVGMLILGLIFLTLPDLKGRVKFGEIFLELLSAILFATSYLILKEAYLGGDFLSVLVWSRLILIPLGLIIIATPLLRRIVFRQQMVKINLLSGAGMLFLLGQLAGGSSELLITFSISLATPALVNSLQGTQYVFLLVLALILSKHYPHVFKESASILIWIGKLTGIILLALGLYVLAFSEGLKRPRLGVTYSPRYAMDLGLEPKSTYLKMLNELKVKLVRIPIYWDGIEKFPKTLNFSSVDFYLNEAQKAGVEVILVIGYKQPRWPECFPPEWVAKLPRVEREERILHLVKAEVEHFKDFGSIVAWQVENEPLFDYGECDPVTQRTTKLLEQEIKLVKSLDQRPIILTDAGELSVWLGTLSKADIFGTTLYRQVWSPLLGSQYYPYPPIFYTLKEKLARILTQAPGYTIISELQVEPWIPKREKVIDVDPRDQAQFFPVSQLRKNLDYAKETNFSQVILWGVEWWYYMDKHGYPQYLEYAKTIF